LDTIILKLTEYSDVIKSELKDILTRIDKKLKITAINAGEDSSYLSYLNGLKKSASLVGIELDILNIYENDKDIFKKRLLETLEKINSDKDNYGTIVGLPLPHNIDSTILSLNLDYKKDIDGISYYNAGRLFYGNPFIVPATPWAVFQTLILIEKKYGYDFSGKNCIIIGRSNSVGKPLIPLLLKKNLTVTTIHTKTKEPEKISREKDLIIACCGVKRLINNDWVKEGAIVIDVGIHCYEEDNKIKICGDVDSETILNKAYLITPVPNGIGSLTNTLLLANCIKSYFLIEKNLEYKFSFEE